MRTKQQSAQLFYSVLLIAVLSAMTLLFSLNDFLIIKPAQADQSLSEPVFVPNGTTPLCRFGVNMVGPIADYDTSLLRMGWYVDYGASGTPAESEAEYVLTIRLQQIGANGYAYNPSGSQLNAAIAANPGAAWLIGNEPDRRDWQDDLEPHVYATAYHDLYQLIKTADPTARIFAGTIVQPTPVRLQYLDRVLDSYQTAYGESMPVDGWSIHNFLLNEVSCDYDPANCWGAEIPPGIDADYGEILTIDDNDDFDLFVERIKRFRQWMVDRGYGGLPVYLSEYGINMPPDFGFGATRVNAFMNATFDYMLSETDPLLGDPADGYRLIQKWSWWSSSDNRPNTNGWLFDPQTKQLTDVGVNFSNYTSLLSDESDLYPVRILTDPAAIFSQGENVTITLKVVVANSGNLVQPAGAAVVRFYDGDPMNGGVQIGTDQSVSLSGCGDNETSELVWADISPGAYQLYVVVDADGAVSESNEQNNVAVQTILVATNRIFLPAILR